MTAISIVIIYLVFSSLLIIVNYYIHLFTTQDQYTRDELKNIFPYFNEISQTLQSKYSIFYLLLLSIVPSLIGIALPLLFNNWLINSSILFIIIFSTFPYLKSNFEKTKVTASDDYRDNFANIFAKHTEIITLSFGAGFGSSLIFVWGYTKEFSFIWFLINIVIIAVLMEITLTNTLKNE